VHFKFFRKLFINFIVKILESKFSYFLNVISFYLFTEKTNN